MIFSLSPGRDPARFPLSFHRLLFLHNDAMPPILFEFSLLLDGLFIVQYLFLYRRLRLVGQAFALSYLSCFLSFLFDHFAHSPSPNPFLKPNLSCVSSRQSLSSPFQRISASPEFLFFLIFLPIRSQSSLLSITPRLNLSFSLFWRTEAPPFSSP